MSMAAIASGSTANGDRGSLALDSSHRALRMPMAASLLIHAGLFAGALVWGQAEGQPAPRGTPDAISVTLVRFSEPAPKPAQPSAAPAAEPAKPVVAPAKPLPARKPEPVKQSIPAEEAPPVPETRPETTEAKAEPRPDPSPQKLLQTASLALPSSGGAGQGTSKGFQNTGGRATDDVFLTEPRFRVAPRPPVYPRRARELEQQGEALIRARLDPRGNPEEVLVWKSSGFVLLDHAALKAVRGWQFEPARRNGRPVVAWVQIPVRFALN